MTEFNAENLVQAKNDFLARNQDLAEFNAPNLEQVGNNCLYSNLSLTTFTAPKLKQAGKCLLGSNIELREFDAPNLERVGEGFLEANHELTKFNVPSLIKFDAFYFFESKPNLIEVNAPNLMDKIPMSIRKRMDSIKSEPQITSGDIAYLDRDNELTTQEVNNAGNFFERLKNKIKDMLPKFNGKNREEDDRDDI